MAIDDIETWAFVFGVISVVLTVRQNVWCWPTGIVNVTLYVIVFLRARLYADTGLQVIYIVLSIYGWYHWLHPGLARAELPVTRLARREGLILLGLGVVSTGGLTFFFARFTDATLPFWDSTTTAMSLVAQWLMTRKVLENWHLWIATDLLYIAMYVYKDLRLTAALYLIFTVLAVAGLREWRKSL